jgi:hypothetical protein
MGIIDIFYCPGAMRPANTLRWQTLAVKTRGEKTVLR